MPLDEYNIYITILSLVLWQQSSHVPRTSQTASTHALLNADTETAIQIIPQQKSFIFLS
jgi:hypothetical protein